MTPYRRISTCLFVAVLVTAHSFASPPQEAFKLVASDGQADHWFGSSLDVDGGLAMVGARDYEQAGLTVGAAYVFDWTTGVELFQLLPSQPNDSMGFGQGISVQGTIGVVGAPGANSGAAAQGQAFVYDLTTGAEIQTLVPTIPTPDQEFASSVQVDGGEVLIGAPGDGAGAGAAFLFDLATGVELVKFTPSSASPGDSFGLQVAMDGDYIVLGSLGKIAVFDRMSGAQLYERARAGIFGFDVDLKDGLLVVGDWVDNTQLGGSVFVYDVATGSLLKRLSAYDRRGGGTFGFSVAISDSHIVVGTNFANGSASSSGSAYVFDRATFQQVARVLPSDSGQFDYLGYSIAIDGTSLFVGAVRDADFRGSAYRFNVPDLAPGSQSCVGYFCPCGTGNYLYSGCPNETGQGALMSSSGTASVSADDLVLETIQLPANRFGIHFMGNQHGPAVTMGNGLRCVTGSIFRYGVQSSGLGSVELGPGIVSTTCTSLPSGGCITAGTSWTFQFWYREAGSPGCTASSNVSTAMTVLFTP